MQDEKPAPTSTTQLQIIPYDELKMGVLLGGGSFGEVRKATWNGKEVAVKKLFLTMFSEKLKKEFDNEAEIMAKCKSPYIIKLHGVSMETGKNNSVGYLIVMEYILRGSLYNVLQDEKEKISWDTRWTIAIDIGEGLSYLHSQVPTIFHRDLKSHNVLVTEDYRAKICDFGVSKIKPQTSGSSDGSNRAIGTRRWMAPELFSFDPRYTKASDVYSYGMVLWEISARKNPYALYEEKDVGEQITKGIKETIPQDCPKAYGDIINETWQEAEKRPTAKEIVDDLTKAKPVPQPGIDKLSNITIKTSAANPKPIIKMNSVTNKEPSSDEVIEAIKDYYKSQSEIQIGISEDETMSIEEGYINLAIVKETEQKEKEKKALEETDDKSHSQKLFHDNRNMSYEDIYGTKNAIEVNDLFKPEKEEKAFNSIVLLGRAGIGKSTVCQYMAYHWAKGDLWKEEKFDVLIWIPLRNLLNSKEYPDNAASLADAVFNECLADDLNGDKPFEKKAFKEAFKKTNSQKNVLYVLDGYDEVAHIEQLPKQQQTSQGKLIQLLLTQKNIILTSRPHYIKQNPFYGENKNPRRVENIGFLDEDIDTYIDKFFNHSEDIQNEQDKTNYARTLKTFLNANRNAKGMAHIPINLTLICSAWKANYDKIKDNKALNLTLSTLYAGLLNALCSRYITKYPPKNEKLNLSSNPNYLEDKTNCSPILEILKKLAFEKMQEKDLIIEQKQIHLLMKEVKEKLTTDEISLDDILNFGLIKATEPSKKESAYYFIHLTFQEFFAACYIADQLKDNAENKEMADFIKSHKYHPHYEIVWWFVSGLLKDDSKALEKFFDLLEDKDTKDIVGLTHQCLLIRCMEECESNVKKESKQEFLKNLSIWVKCLIYEKNNALNSILNYLTISPIIFTNEEILATLGNCLKDQDEDVRSSAAEALGNQSGLPENILVMLVNCLKDQDKDVRSSAAEALGNQSGLPENILVMLVNCLKDQDKDVRRSAVKALGNQSGLPENILVMLVNCLKDQDWNVRRSAAMALSKQSGLPENILVMLGNCLKDQDWKVRSSAAEALGKQSGLPENILVMLGNCLKDQDWNVKRSAAMALGKQSGLPENILGVLVNCLKDQDEDIRSSAVLALGKQSGLPENILVMLRNCLKDQDWNVRHSAAEALGKQSGLPENILGVLVNCLKDQDEDIRRYAAEALGKQSGLPENILMMLGNCLKDQDWNVRRSAAEALGKQSGLPENILVMLGNCLKDQDRDVRRSAAEALGNQSGLPENILVILVNCLKDQDWNVRRYVAETLGKQSGLPENILVMLGNCLKDQDWNVRRSAAMALSKQSGLPENILVMLINCLKDQDWDVRHYAARVLCKQSGLLENILVMLANCLKDQDEDVRRSAAMALGKQSGLPENILVMLVNCLEDQDQYVRRSAAEALGNQSGLLENILVMLANCLKDQDQDEDVRRSAAMALGKQSGLPENILVMLVNCLEDQDVRLYAAEALGKQSGLPENILVMLGNCLKDQDEDVRNSAAEALSNQSLLYIVKIFESSKNDKLINILIVRSLEKKLPIYFHESALYIGSEKLDFQDKDHLIEVSKKVLIEFIGFQAYEVTDNYTKKLISDNYQPVGLFGKIEQSPASEKDRLALILHEKIFKGLSKNEISQKSSSKNKASASIEIELTEKGGLSIKCCDDEKNENLLNNFLGFLELFKRNQYKTCQSSFPVFKITSHHEIADFLEKHLKVDPKRLYEEAGLDFNKLFKQTAKKEENSGCVMM